MPLYFLKGEKDLPQASLHAEGSKKPDYCTRAILLIVGLALITLASITQAAGLVLPWESRLPKALGIPCPTPARTVFLSLPDGTNGKLDPMDVALVLRGLSMLHPSLILLTQGTPSSKDLASGDSAQLLQGVKDQLRSKGIPLREASTTSQESRWRPVPLCLYLSPGWFAQGVSLPSLPGTAPTEGTLRYMPGAVEEPGILPLFAVTPSDEIIASLWWDGLMQGQPNAPVWLIAGRILILANHAALPFAKGGLSVPRDPHPVETVAADDFLLKMEQRERGDLSPGFDSLWEHAVVVVGPPSVLPSVSALAAIREMTEWGALPLTWQGVILLLLIGIVACVRSLSRRPASLITMTLLITGIAGACWAIRHGVLPPILPWSVAFAAGITEILIKRR